LFGHDLQKLNFTPRELLTISTAVISVGGEEVSNLLPDIFQK